MDVKIDIQLARITSSAGNSSSLQMICPDRVWPPPCASADDIVHSRSILSHPASTQHRETPNSRPAGCAIGRNMATIAKMVAATERINAPAAWSLREVPACQLITRSTPARPQTSKKTVHAGHNSTDQNQTCSNLFQHLRATWNVPHVSRFPKARLRTSAHTRCGGTDSSLEDEAHEGERGEAATSSLRQQSHLCQAAIWAIGWQLEMSYAPANGLWQYEPLMTYPWKILEVFCETNNDWSLVGLQLVWEKDPSRLPIKEGPWQCPNVKQDQGPRLSWTITLPVDHGWCCAPWQALHRGS